MNAHTAGSVYEPAVKILSPLCSLFNSSNCVKVSLNAAVTSRAVLARTTSVVRTCPKGKAFVKSSVGETRSMSGEVRLMMGSACSTSQTTWFCRHLSILGGARPWPRNLCAADSGLPRSAIDV